MSLELADLLARAEVTDVLARYAHGVDRGDWALVRSCYHEDAYDDHGLYAGGLDGLIDFVKGLSASLTTTTHHLGNALVRIEGDEAYAETACTGWYQRLDRSGGERMIVQGLRYLDVLQRREGRWAISKRTVVLDWEHLLAATPARSIASTWTRGARGVTDPAYTHLRLQDEAERAP